MTNRTVKVIKNKVIKSDELHFQYVPGRFIREVYGGNEETKLLIRNSPHYSFLKEYEKIGKEVYKANTNYYKMQKAWGRNEKFVLKKMKKLTGLYNDIRKNGLKARIQVVKEPLYERTFDNGYEIYDGHHRASVCVILGYESIKCVIVNVKFK